MTFSDAIDCILPAFEQYYTIKKDNITEPFCAEAEFRSHNEQYLLVRAAHIADEDSNEYVFFAQEKNLSEEKLCSIVDAAWSQGLSRVKPYYGHKNSDITVIIFTEQTEQSLKKAIKKTNRYKSYKFSLYGWSRLKLVVAEVPANNYFCNSHGADVCKMIKANFKKCTY
jgi:hypothetical protein